MSSRFIIYIVLFSFLLSPVLGWPSDRNINFFEIDNANVAEYLLIYDEGGCIKVLPVFLGLNVAFYNYALTGKNLHALLNEGNCNNVWNQLKENDYAFIGIDNDSTTRINEKKNYQKAITNFIEGTNQKKAIHFHSSPIMTQKENDVIPAQIGEILDKNKIVCNDLS